MDLELKTDVLKGRWNVVFRPKENHGELEQIEFVDDSLRFYRNGASEPAMEAAWNSNEKGWLCVATMGKEFRLCKIDDTALVMVEQVGDVGFVWEMAPAEK